MPQSSYEYESVEGIVFAADVRRRTSPIATAKIGDTPKWSNHFIEIAKDLMGLVGGSGKVVEDEDAQHDLPRYEYLLPSRIPCSINA